MATYLPGVTDYIPQIQPFKPDFNFYANILQTKEAQYKAGYQKLSGIYGSLLNSEMLRDDNNNRREQFFYSIDNNIKTTKYNKLIKAISNDINRSPTADELKYTKAYFYQTVYLNQEDTIN